MLCCEFNPLYPTSSRPYSIMDSWCGTRNRRAFACPLFRRLNQDSYHSWCCQGLDWHTYWCLHSLQLRQDLDWHTCRCLHSLQLRQDRECKHQHVFWCLHSLQLRRIWIGIHVGVSGVRIGILLFAETIGRFACRTVSAGRAVQRWLGAEQPNIFNGTYNERLSYLRRCNEVG